MPSATSRRAAARGISTAEVLAAVGLSLLVGAVLHQVQWVQQRAFFAQGAYAESQHVTRTALDLMARELRMAAFDPTGTALPVSPPGPCCPGARQGLMDAGPERVRFRQDLNSDGAIGTLGEDLAYELAGGAIVRHDGAAASPLVESVPAGGRLLRYFTDANPPVELIPSGSPASLSACQRDCVAKVAIRVRAAVPNPDPSIAAPLTSQAASEIAIRNRSLETF